MNLFCLTLTLTINKPKKKESSFNFIRLHSKPHIEPLVTPPATPLVSVPRAPAPTSQEQPQSADMQLESGTSKFTERLELPPSFYETSSSESTAELVPEPLEVEQTETTEARRNDAVRTCHRMGASLE